MSRIFSQYRALGLCTSDVPFVIKYSAHSSTYYALVPIGETFNVYKLPRLTLVGISDPVHCNIRAFACSRRLVFAAADNVIYVYRNSRYLSHELRGHNTKINLMVVFSGRLLASLDESCLLKVWNMDSCEAVFSMQFSSESFNITAISNPLGYKNKLLLGSYQGPLQLWNVRSQKQLYWFKGFGAPVSCIAQAPAVDVCAIGLADGRVCLHNVKYDTTLLNFVHDGGAVTTISFRNGSHGLNNPSNVDPKSELLLLADGRDDLFMVTGYSSGQVNCWQLKEKGECRPVGSTKTLHWDRIVSMFCLPGGDAAGALVTSGADNCIKVSYFDRPDGGPRTVYKRSGHFRPPNRVNFWPGGSAGGSLLLSAGQDSMLRIFSTFNDQLDKSLGRAYAPGVPDRRKTTADQRASWLLPGVSQLALCATRADDWDSLVAIHTGRRQATTWNFVNATRGRHWLDPAKFSGKGGAAVRLYKQTVATSVFVTNCGNYVLLGYSSGDAFKFNLQSGLERGSYGEPAAHTSAVVGISVNNVNRQTATVGGNEVRFWSFHKHDLLHTSELPSTALFSRFNGDTDALAVALADGPILLFDATHHRVIRRLANSESQPCVDLTISTDGRWLISAHHGDPLIKTWDIVCGKLIDCFRVNTPITSLSLSPAGEFLATTHANSLGVHLWDNRGTYQRLHLQPLADDYRPPLTEKPVAVPSRSLVVRFQEDAERGFKTMELALRDSDGEDPQASPSREGISDDSIEVDLDRESNTQPLDDVYISPEQLPDHLATLSGLPTTYLSSLLHLDLIRERNRRAVIPSNIHDETKLPFFLPVVETAKGLAWVDADNGTMEVPSSEANTVTETTTSVVEPIASRSLKRRSVLDDDGLTAIEPVPGLMTRLIQAKKDEEFDEIMQTLKSIGPSALDLEIRLLAVSADEELAVHASLKDASCGSKLVDTTRDRLHGFLRLLINRFERNLDVDLACVCLESLLLRHGDLLLVKPSDHAQIETTDNVGNQIHALLSTEHLANKPSLTTELVSKAVAAKARAASLLTRRLTRSICLVDFIRNPTTTLHF